MHLRTVHTRRTARREHRVQLGERLAPPALRWGHMALGEPLADLESRPSVGLVVELDSQSRLERSEVPWQLAGDAHDPIEQLPVDDVGEVDAALGPAAGIVREDLGPSLEATRADVELDLFAWQWVAERTPPRGEPVRVGERPVGECAAHRRCASGRAVGPSWSWPASRRAILGWRVRRGRRLRGGNSGRVIAQTVESLVPELLLLRQTGRRARGRRRRESRAAPPAVLGPGDDRRALEHLEVPGDRGEADKERGCELRDRRVADCESLDDAPPGGVSERAEEQVKVLAGALRRDI
jgi:hypothetical protein